MASYMDLCLFIPTASHGSCIPLLNMQEPELPKAIFSASFEIALRQLNISGSIKVNILRKLRKTLILHDIS